MDAPRDIDAAPAKEFHVEEDPDRLPNLEGMQPIGVIHSTYRNHFATPPAWNPRRAPRRVDYAA